MKTAFFYSERYSDFDYGDSHPLRMERLRLTYELCKAYHLFDLPDSRLVEVAPATESDILRYHSGPYVQVLKEASRGQFKGLYPHGLGPGDNPIFQGLWDWSLLHTGGSLGCARRVLDGEARIAFHIAGGLHHALRDKASGFCYVNDPVLVIYHLLDRGKRVMYLDIDAHHGDGVQWAFYEEPKVLTVSFHQDGRSLFPGTGDVSETGRGNGLGYAINVPMLPGTDDTVFWQGFSAIVPKAMELFRADMIVSQLGVDSFTGDPLASLELTTNGFGRVISYLTAEAPAWVALGGGGYDPSIVARAWTLAWAIMNGVDLPQDLPDSMEQGLVGCGPGGRRLRDEEHRSKRQEQCSRFMGECVRHIEEHVFPKIHAGLR